MTALDPKENEPVAPTSATPDQDLQGEVERLTKERNELRKELDERGKREASPGRARGVIATVLTILATLLLIVTLPALWTYRTLLDTDYFVERVSPVVQEPPVTAVLSDRLTDQVFSLLDVQNVVADALPPQAGVLVGPVTGAVQGFVRDQVNTVLESDQFERAWIAANRVAHAEVVAALRGEGDTVRVENGQVTLNLLPIINQVLNSVESHASQLLGRDVQLPNISQGEVPESARQKISDALGVEVPSNLGQIVVFQSDSFETAQQAVKFFDRGIVLLVIGTVVLLVAALWTSLRRRRTFLQITVGTLIGLVVLRRLGFWLEDEVAARASTPEGARALRAITSDVLSSFFGISRTLIILGLVLVFIALITGPYRWAVVTREKTAALFRSGISTAGEAAHQESTVVWIRAHREALQLGGAIAAVVIFLFFDLSWPLFLIIGGLLVAYELALLRMGAAGPSEKTA
jgi:hypothetical protein